MSFNKKELKKLNEKSLANLVKKLKIRVVGIKKSK